MSFTKEMENHLKTMGWYPNRKITTYDEFMEKYNYPEFIREFIRGYGGLKLNSLSKLGDEIHKDKINFILNPLDTYGMDSESIASGWSEDIGRQLFVIGSFLSQNSDVAVDKNGAVYIIGEYCYCVGKDFYQGIESIIHYDLWSSLELDPKNPKSGIWYVSKGDRVDFDTYEFKYRTF